MATSSGRNRPVAAVRPSSRARWARPTGRSEPLTRRLGDAYQAVGELLGDVRRTDGHAPQIVGRAGVPLSRVGEDRPCPLGHATEVDLGNRQRAVADEPDVELAPGDVFLDEDLVELLRHRGHARTQRLAVADYRAAIQPRARVLRGRLDDGGERKVVLDLALRHRPARDREARLGEQRVDDRFATTRRDGPEAGPRERDAGELEGPHDVLFPFALAVHAFAQIEDQVGAAGHLEPAHVVSHRDLADLVTGAHGAEDRADLVHGSHDAADVLRCPVLGTGVVEDDDSHALTATGCRTVARATISAPASRRHAIRATSWISSSYPNPAARAALGKQEFIAGSGMMPGSGLS